MLKSNGTVYRVLGNVSMWDVTAVLQPYKEEWSEERTDLIYVNPEQFKESFLILDEGKDKLSETLKLALSNIASNKPLPK